MKRIHLLVPALLVLALAGGCTVRGGFHARATAPSMVLINPGVYVIEDYNEPVFYSEGAYWRYHNNVWYSSHVHTGGWARVHTVPGHVRRIDRPHTYVHYRGTVRGRGNVHHGRPAGRDHRQEVRQDRRDDRRDHRDARPSGRDHRAPNANVRPRGTTNNAGGVRVKTDVKVKAKVRVRGETNNPGRPAKRDHR